MYLDIIREISLFGPHPGGSKEELEVAKYFRDHIENFCKEVEMERFEYFDMKGKKKSSVNVIGRMGPDNGKKKIMICTNLDTIKDMDEVSERWERGEKEVYDVPHVEGANEPNSAIAFLIFLAKSLAGMRLKREILLVAFGAQEEWYGTPADVKDTSSGLIKKFKRFDYLIGSQHYVISHGIDDIESVIAIDAVAIGFPKMVSRDSFGKNTIKQKDLDLETIKILGFRYRAGKRTVGAISCDHLPFRLMKIPSTWIITTNGYPKERYTLGYVLNHENIPNYGTYRDTFENLLGETTERIVQRNFFIIGEALRRYLLMKG